MSETAESPVCVGFDPAVEPKPEPEEKKLCEITEFFSKSEIDLIKAAPNNPMVRAHILKKIGQMPPEERDSYIKIKNWIEKNIPSRNAPRAAGAAPAPFVPEREAFGIDVDFMESVRGRCSYSGTQYGSGTYVFTEEEVADKIREVIADGRDFPRLLRSLREEILYNGYDRINPTMQDSGDGYDYDDHEETDSDGAETDFPVSELEANLKDYIREHHPEHMAHFGIT